MAYLTIETSATRNKKFIKAGPAPSWLWVCGLAYCQEGLTDGFIPREALPYLGVKNPVQLAGHLVEAGLWHAEEDGWRVNDYLEHNRSAFEVSVLKERRGKGGRLGGRPKKAVPETLEVLHKVTDSETLVKTFPVAVAVADVVVVTEKKKEEHGDIAFAAFRDAYPPARRKGGFLAMSAFMDAMANAGSAQPLMDALANHKASEQWSKPNLIPGMDTWLREERWRQTLPSVGETAKPDRFAILEKVWAAEAAAERVK